MARISTLLLAVMLAIASIDLLRSNSRYSAGTLTSQDATLKVDRSVVRLTAAVALIGGAVLRVTGAVLCFAF